MRRLLPPNFLFERRGGAPGVLSSLSRTRFGVDHRVNPTIFICVDTVTNKRITHELDETDVLTARSKHDAAFKSHQVKEVNQPW